MRGLIIILLAGSGLFAQTIHISGNYRDLLDNPIDSASVYYYQDQVVVDSTLTSSSGAFDLQFTIVSVNPSLPSNFQLSQNYPNPFNPSTRIDLSIQESGSFSIYTIRGALVESLDLPSAGSYALTWDGRNLGAGLYIYVLRSGEQSSSRKMILLDGGDGSGLAANQVSYASSSSLAKPASNAAIRFEKNNTTPLVVNFFTPQADTSFGNINGNIGPVLIQTIPDTAFIVGEPWGLDWNDYFYNDSESMYIESIFMPPDSGDSHYQVQAWDLIDSTLTSISNIFSVSEIQVNEAPQIILPDTVYLMEDQEPGFILDLLNYSSDVENDSLIFSVSYQEHPELVNVYCSGDSLILDSLQENWFGSSIIQISVFDGENTSLDTTLLLVEAVNDAPIFEGYIEDFLANEDNPDYLIPVHDIFSDPDGDNLSFTLNLPPGYYSPEAAGLYLFLEPGTDFQDLQVTANDGELDGQSNYFNASWPIIIVPPDTFNVHFVMKDFKTDNILTDGESTWTIDGIEYTSNDGTFDIDLEEGIHSFNATNPNTIDGVVGNHHSGDFLFLRHPGETENFEQIAGPDTVSNIEVTQQDTIFAYKIMADFNMDGVAVYLNSEGNGTVRFAPEDLQAYAWFDTGGTHITPVDYIRNTVLDLLENQLPAATHGKLQLQYIESDVNPNAGGPILQMYVDSSVPGSGTNYTGSVNGNITLASATWPLSPPPGNGDLVIEISQAVADLPDLAGSNPPIFNYIAGVGYVLNELGEDIFGLDYFVNSNTFFDD